VNSAELVGRLQEVGQKLKAAARWNGSLHDVDSDEDHYIYELLCYFKLSMAATPHFNLKIVLRSRSQTGNPAALWPRAPGKKQNYSYICLHNQADECEYELCPGINITDRYNMDRAADINLLLPSQTEQPLFSHLCAIWDAKHRRITGRLSGPEVSDFIVTFEALGKPEPSVSWRQIMPQAFRKSGLLTNGLFSTEPVLHLQDRSISETEHFPDAPTTRP
jgi:hypothetical protein